MSTQQPEALRLAELLEGGPRRSGDGAIAAELRRLHSANEAHARSNVTLVRENSELLAQRNKLLEALSYIEGLAMADEPRDLPTIAKTAHEAIAKAEGREA